MKQGLKRKLILSDSMIALCGVLLLLISLSGIFVLRGQTNMLVEEAMPMVQETANIQIQLQKSLAALRGWMNVPDPQFKLERKNAWSKGIDPKLHSLQRLMQETGNLKLADQLKKINIALDDLKMWQWRIEDVSQTPGDNPALTFMKNQITLSGKHIVAYINGIIQEEKRFNQKAQNFEIYQLTDLRESFAQSLALINEYVLTGSKVKLDRSKALILSEKEVLNKIIASKKTLTNYQRILLEKLSKSFEYYPSLVDELVLLKSKRTESISNNLLSTQAVPLARNLERQLDKIINEEKKKLWAAKEEVEFITEIIIYSMGIFIFLLILLSFWISNRNANRFLSPIALLLEATQKIADGKLNHKIKVITDDELGKLTESFNQMLCLRELAEERIRKIVETAIDPIITIDIHGIVCSMNSATTKLLGYLESELVGYNIAIIMPEPYHSEHDQYIKNYLNTRNRKIIGKSREVRARSKSGEIIPVTLSVSEIIVGEEHFFTGIIRDIRHEKSQALEMENLNKKLTQENQEKDIIADLENVLRGIDQVEIFSNNVLKFFAERFNLILGMFYIVNTEKKKIALVSGYGFKERRSRTTEFNWGEGLVGECVKNKVPVSIEEPPKDYFKVSSGSGESLPKEVFLLPLLIDEEILGAIEFCALKSISTDTKNFINSLLQNVTINLKILLAQEKQEHLLKKTQSQKETLQEQEEELRSSNEELESQAQSLKQSEEELRSTNDELNEQLNLIEIQKEELKKQSEELKEISRYKSEFLANMSHELRTPLNSLLILAQGFMNNKAGNLSADQQEEAKIIYESGSDLLTLINDVLDISKVEAGKLLIEIQPIGISDIAAVIERQFNPLAQQRGVQFFVELDKNLPNTINTDQVRLLQILKNLISNAIKFTEEGSVSLKISLKDQFVTFEVIDTGIGIPKDKQSLVFSEFQQADGSTSRKYGGTGLGLSISKKLAELMNGRLTLESEEGKGSIFIFSMPLNLIPDTEESANSGVVNTAELTLNQEPAVETISLPNDLSEIPNDLADDRDKLDSNLPILLVIDDDVHFLRLIGNLIHDNQFQVLLSLTGDTGIKLAMAYQPNGIVLDLGLPDMSGEEVLTVLKQNPKTANIPVHIISAKDKSNELLEKGALSFLQKPVKEEDLISLIGQLSSSSANKILVVEDDYAAQKELHEVFDSFNIEVQADFVKTAAAAIEKLAMEDYSCLILDLELPDAFGIELVEKLVKKMRQTTPIIIYTARELTGEEFKKINQYTNKVIVKGVEAKERLIDEVQLFFHHIEKQTGYAPKIENNQGNQLAKFDGERVLLVDDDLRNTFALSRALEVEGLEVVIADNGELAIEKLSEESPFDLILMDIMMPIMDGYEAIRKIKSMADYKDIPIIALTAKATEQDKKQCIEAGANDYLNKPVDLERLLQLIRVWISN